MRRFSWRLQRVLNIKKKQEKIKRSELLAATEKLAKKHSKLMVQEMMLKQAISDLDEEDALERIEKQMLFLKLSSVNDKIIKCLKSEIAQLKEKQNEKKAEVLQVKRYKEGLEKLRAQAKREFIKEQEKLEQKQIDDITSLSFARDLLEENKNQFYVMQGEQSE